MTDFNDPENPNTPQWQEIHHTIVIDPNQLQNDPGVLMFLPPEIRKMISRDIKQGAGGNKDTKQNRRSNKI